MKKSRIKWKWLIILIVFIYLYHLFLGLPIKNSLIYHTSICLSEREPKSNEILFKFISEKIVSCKRIRVAEEDIVCTDSPCPEYTVFYRGKTTRQGSFIVPKNEFNNDFYSFVNGPEKIINNQKRYLFHIDGNLNGKIIYENLFQDAQDNDNKISVTVHEVFSDDYCEGPLFDHQRDFCD